MARLGEGSCVSPDSLSMGLLRIRSALRYMYMVGAGQQAVGGASPSLLASVLDCAARCDVCTLIQTPAAWKPLVAFNDCASRSSAQGLSSS
jgi:hypothetical protein